MNFIGNNMFLFKKVTLIVCIFLFSIGTGLCERKKVGLVLSGGGAKGVAHIGVLKVLEEAGIPIDFIAGTSMGAIIGGLYAVGYDAHTLDSLVRAQNWPFLLNDMIHRYNLPFYEKERNEIYLISVPIFGEKFIQIPTGFVSGQNINNLFTELTFGYHDSISFDELPIPYACLATNLVDGKEAVLEKGSLPLSMRASMAIPGVFAPVRLDSMLLVDGGIVNNLPVDIARAKEMDIIIGVDVTAELRDIDQLNSAFGVVDQLISFMGMEKYRQSAALTDLYIKPNIIPYSASSFDPASLDTLIRRGEEAARKQWNEILLLKEKIGMEPDEKMNTQKQYKYVNMDSIYIHEIYIEGVDEKEEVWVRKKCGIKENTAISTHDLQRGISLLYGTGVYSYVNYRLSGTEKRDLTLILKAKPSNSLNIGFRFDNYDKGALLLNTMVVHPRLKSFQFALTGRLSTNPYVRADFYFGNSFKRKVGLSYMFMYNDIYLYDRGKKVDNFTYYHHIAGLNYSGIYINNFKFQLGVQYEHFRLNSFLTSGESSIEEMKKNRIFLSYNVTTQYDTYDKKYYPTTGIGFKAGYALYTEKLFDYENAFSTIYADFSAALPVSRRFNVMPFASGRVVIGDDIPLIYQNFAGGTVAGRYYNQQIAFAGISDLENFEKSIISGGLKFRYRLGAKHYITLIGNYMQFNNKFTDILENTGIIGGSIGYSYDLMIGPVDVVFSISNWDKKMGFYFDLGFYF